MKNITRTILGIIGTGLVCFAVTAQAGDMMKRDGMMETKNMEEKKMMHKEMESNSMDEKMMKKGTMEDKMKTGM